MKKEELNYFDSFLEISDFSIKACEILKEFTKSFEVDKTEEIEKKIHIIEHDADLKQHKLLNYLIKDFLPPIDREDIFRLAHRIDDVIDNIDEFAINLDILNVKSLREDTNQFINLLHKCCVDMNELFKTFNNIKLYKEIKQKVIEINELEEEGDLLFQNAMKNLYRNEKDAIEVVKWNTLYNCLEDCIDSCEHVADCIEEILMKNS